jgi:hypothetical protein
LKDYSAKDSINSVIVTVIEKELIGLSTLSSQDIGGVEGLNSSFLKGASGSYLSLVEGSKVLYDLSPKLNRDKALQILLQADLSKSNLSYKVINYLNRRIII